VYTHSLPGNLKMSFNPIPTTPSKCTNLKMNISLNEQFYVAGGVVEGVMELNATVHKSLLLGDIYLTLQGVEGSLKVSQIHKKRHLYSFLKPNKKRLKENSRILSSISSKSFKALELLLQTL
jgi:hypothetical protein